MRLTALTLIGGLGLAVAAMPAGAAPVLAPTDAHPASGIIKVWGGCGPYRHPVPGHWSRWRGGWVPPHCAPNRWARPYAGWGYRQWGWHHRDYYY